MELQILVDNGGPLDDNIISMVPFVTVVPVVGCEVTTEEGIFTIVEVGIDYRKNQIHAWADKDYTEF